MVNLILRYWPYPIKNLSGGRGLENGVLVFDCPVCGERDARGFISTERRRGGCFRASCQVSGSHKIRYYLEKLKHLGLISHEQATELLKILGAGLEIGPTTPAKRGEFRKKRTFVRIPGELKELTNADLPRTWRRISAFDLESFGFRRISSPYGDGIFVPVTYKFSLCYFTIRFFSGGYRAAAPFEASHAKHECLFGADFVPTGARSCVIIVESAHDACGVSLEYRVPAVALLGSSISRDQVEILLDKQVKMCIVALDADAESKSAQVQQELERCGIPAIVGTWVHGKDWSEGGKLVV